ncbi:hypothetical protein OG331_51080 [Streptomyces sp. NBC_01017]|nr:hypothetical protein OG331_00890 [Streptomyces sp. NBC_01017]WSV35259.1 hypothetical protein OG331_51080 [Streptomyces sp. NBC_01017]
MRRRTVEVIGVLIGRLRAMRAQLVACPDEADEVRALPCRGAVLHA